MMVVRRKLELVKTTNKRSTKTHEGRIITKRTTVETKDEGQRKPKVKESFKVINNKKSQWYDKDGCEYTGDTKKKYTKCVSENDFLLTKIAELEKKIETQKKVQSTNAKKWGKEAVDLTNQLIEADVLIADGVIGQSENHPQKKVITIKGPKKMRAPQRLQLKNLNAKKRTTAKKKQIEDDPEDAPLNEYLKSCQKKQKRNKDKMESMGLVNVSKKQRKIAKKSVH